MKKPILFISLSYALLTACGTAVSLSDNYFEDENFYNPALPAPLFASSSAAQAPSSNRGEALNYDALWGNEQDSTVQVYQNRSAQSQGGMWSSQPGMNYGYPNTLVPMSFWQWRLYQQQLQFGLQPFGWGASPYSNNFYHQGYQSWGWPMGGAWGSQWYDPWNPYGSGYSYDYYNGWNGGYGNMWYDPWSPYGFGSPIWYNGWSNGWNTGNNAGNNNGNNNGRSGTNYGGRRPSKYNTTRGNSSSSGRTGQTPTNTPTRNPYKDVQKDRGNSPRDQNSKPNQSLPTRRKIQRSSDNGSTPVRQNQPTTKPTRDTRESTRPPHSTETRSYRNSSVDRPKRTPASTTSPSRTYPASTNESSRRMEPQRSPANFSPSSSSSSPARSSSNNSNSSGRRR